MECGVEGPGPMEGAITLDQPDAPMPILGNCFWGGNGRVGLPQADTGKLEGSQQVTGGGLKPPLLTSNPATQTLEAAKGKQGLAGQFAEERIRLLFPAEQKPLL